MAERVSHSSLPEQHTALEDKVVSQSFRWSDGSLHPITPTLPATPNKKEWYTAPNVSQELPPLKRASALQVASEKIEPGVDYFLSQTVVRPTVKTTETTPQAPVDPRFSFLGKPLFDTSPIMPQDVPDHQDPMLTEKFLGEPQQQGVAHKRRVERGSTQHQGLANFLFDAGSAAVAYMVLGTLFPKRK
jgi:hypothetical protein